MHTVRVPLVPSSAAVVRHRLVRELASRVPEEVLDTAALLVSELVGNAVRHGRPLPGGGLLASWELAGPALRVEVLDGGGGPPVGPAPHAPPSAESGRGLELVAALAARWGRAPAPGGTAVWVELSAAPAGQAGDEEPAHPVDTAPPRTLRLPDALPLPVSPVMPPSGAPGRVLRGSRVLRLP